MLINVLPLYAAQASSASSTSLTSSDFYLPESDHLFPIRSPVECSCMSLTHTYDSSQEDDLTEPVGSSPPPSGPPPFAPKSEASPLLSTNFPGSSSFSHSSDYKGQQSLSCGESVSLPPRHVFSADGKSPVHSCAKLFESTSIASSSFATSLTLFSPSSLSSISHFPPPPLTEAVFQQICDDSLKESLGFLFSVLVSFKYYFYGVTHPSQEASLSPAKLSAPSTPVSKARLSPSPLDARFSALKRTGSFGPPSPSPCSTADQKRTPPRGAPPRSPDRALDASQELSRGAIIERKHYQRQCDEAKTIMLSSRIWIAMHLSRGRAQTTIKDLLIWANSNGAFKAADRRLCLLKYIHDLEQWIGFLGCSSSLHPQDIPSQHIAQDIFEKELKPLIDQNTPGLKYAGFMASIIDNSTLYHPYLSSLRRLQFILHDIEWLPCIFPLLGDSGSANIAHIRQKVVEKQASLPSHIQCVKTYFSHLVGEICQERPAIVQNISREYNTKIASLIFILDGLSLALQDETPVLHDSMYALSQAKLGITLLQDLEGPYLNFLQGLNSLPMQEEQVL